MEQEDAELAKLEAWVARLEMPGNRTLTRPATWEDSGCRPVTGSEPLGRLASQQKLV